MGIDEVVGDAAMKALSGAIGLVFFSVMAVFVWALANGSSLSGEPTAVLQISNSQKPLNTSRVERAPVAGAGKFSGGRMQVVLDVAPTAPTAVRPKSAPGRGGNSGLLEKSKFGLLPKRAKDGRRPAKAYARVGPGKRDIVPRIAVLFTGLGLNQRLSQKAVTDLPADITLAFSAYGQKLDRLVSQAQRFGHELMLQVPMEPIDYPASDTGPKTLLAAKSMRDNLSSLYWSLGRFTGYFGVVNAKGGRYLANKAAAQGLFKELQKRGLVFFHDSSRVSAVLAKLAGQNGLGYARSTLQIDRKPNPESITLALKKLESIARRSGIAVGVARMHPVSIDMISQWVKKLEAGNLRLVPVSAAYQQTRVQ